MILTSQPSLADAHQTGQDNGQGEGAGEGGERGSPNVTEGTFAAANTPSSREQIRGTCAQAAHPRPVSTSGVHNEG